MLSSNYFLEKVVFKSRAVLTSADEWLLVIVIQWKAGVTTKDYDSPVVAPMEDYNNTSYFGLHIYTTWIGSYVFQNFPIELLFCNICAFVLCLELNLT